MLILFLLWFFVLSLAGLVLWWAWLELGYRDEFASVDEHDTAMRSLTPPGGAA